MIGIDVSVNNGHINWDQVKADPQNVSFAFIKTTQGVGYRDPHAAENAYGASHIGIKFGYYHFASLNSKMIVNDASSEAQAFIAAMRSLPMAALPAVLDIETDEIDLHPDEVLLWANTFLSIVKAAGYHPMVYSGPYFLNDHLPTNHNLNQYPLWLAEYASRISILPKGWTKANVWQFSAKGKVQGIVTDVDMNQSDLIF